MPQTSALRCAPSPRPDPRCRSAQGVSLDLSLLCLSFIRSVRTIMAHFSFLACCPLVSIVPCLAFSLINPSKSTRNRFGPIRPERSEHPPLTVRRNIHRLPPNSPRNSHGPQYPPLSQCDCFLISFHHLFETRPCRGIDDRGLRSQFRHLGPQRRCAQFIALVGVSLARSRPPLAFLFSPDVPPLSLRFRPLSFPVVFF